MKTFLPILLGLLILGPAVPSPAQEGNPASRPPGSAQRSASTDGHDFSLGDVLGEYGRLVGKKILTDNTITLSTSLTLLDLDGVDPQQKAGLIDRTLFLNGFTLVDADKGTVLVLGPGKNPRSVGLPLYTKPEELPAGERVFSYLFKLEHRNAIEVAGILQQHIPPGNDVNFTADKGSDSLIATARTSVMRNVIRLVAAFDVNGTAR